MTIRADDLVILAEVARSGSLQRAAESLGLDHSTLSRRIATLDRQMGSPTVRRSAQGTRLTELGERLLRPAGRVEAALREVQQLASASAGDGGLTGLLRVNSVEGFGRAFVTPALARLMNQNPGLRIEISTGTRPIPQSIAADVEISVAPSSRRMAHNYALAKYHLALYASRDYLERRGAPRSAAELHDHPLIYYVESEMRVERLVVIQKHLPEADIRLGSPNVFIQVAATTAGAGIGLLPVFLARHEPGLVPVLEDEVRITLEFHASVANRPATQPASQAFLRELARELQARGSELLASD